MFCLPHSLGITDQTVIEEPVSPCVYAGTAACKLAIALPDLSIETTKRICPWKPFSSPSVPSRSCHRRCSHVIMERLWLSRLGCERGKRYCRYFSRLHGTINKSDSGAVSEPAQGNQREANDAFIKDSSFQKYIGARVISWEGSVS